MKIKFGVDVTTNKEIVLVEPIDNDSLRFYLSELRQQNDSQSYHDLKAVILEGLQMIKINFEWVAERVASEISHCIVIVLMSSTSYLGHCEKYNEVCRNFGNPGKP